MAVGHLEVVSQSAPTPGRSIGKVAFFDENGDPIDLGGGTVTVTWADVTGKPATFPAATHTHTVAQVDGLQAIIDDYETRIAALEAAAV